MNSLTILLLVMLASAVVLADERETKDLDVEDAEDLGRGRRKRKKQQLLASSYGGGGYGGGGYGSHGGPCGRTFGDKLFGWGTPSHTYVSAPVNNYYFDCGGHQHQPVFPAPVPYPVPFPQPVGGHQHHHQHHHGHHGQHGGFNNFQGPVGQPYHDEGYQRPNRPVAGVVSAAASGLGTALADYVTGGGRPKKPYRQITKTVNQLFKPFYNLF